MRLKVPEKRFSLSLFIATYLRSFGTNWPSETWVPLSPLEVVIVERHSVGMHVGDDETLMTMLIKKLTGLPGGPRCPLSHKHTSA